MKHFLLARYQLADDAFLLREIRGIVQEAIARGHRVTLLTHESTSLDALPAGLEIQKVSGSRRDFVRVFQTLCDKKEFSCTFALDPLPEADFCLPDDLPLHPYASCRRTWNRFSEKYFQYKQEELLCRAPAKTLIFCASELQKLALRVQYGVLPQRIRMLPPMLDDMTSQIATTSDASAKFRQFLRCEDDTLLVLYFVTPHAEMEIRRCLNALAIMPEALRDRCCFLAVGELGDSGLDFLRHIAQAVHFPIGQLRFLPKADDRILLLQAAALLLQPSDDDYCGNDLIDALACGLPVICTAGNGCSPFVQTSGCPVVPVPFDQEIFQEALAFTLPKAELLRKMLENRARKFPQKSRSAAILDQLESFSSPSGVFFSEEEIQEIVTRHLEQTGSKTALKSDRKRDISRVALADRPPVIVKEFKRLHWWDGERHLRRCQAGTALLRFLTPQCLASSTHPSTQSSFLLFRDCGTGNFYKEDYFDRTDLKSLYTACGALLAFLHAAGIYHKDTKPANFVLNENCQDECPHPVCLVDCDNVLRYPLPFPRRCRVHNLAQFIAGTGKLARADQARWGILIRAFQDGYNRNSLLTQPELKELWRDFWHFLAAGKHVEYNLPFSCGSADLQILRKSLH